MITLHHATTEEDQQAVRDLFWEYLQWANGRVNEEFGVNFDIKTMLSRDMAKMEIYSPPAGCLMLAIEGSSPAGVGCLKELRRSTAEIKRMYVRPAFRGRGIGRALIEALLAEARDIGYRSVRLDSARFMKEAHALYRSAGFEEIEPYPESEVPADFQKHWLFMERRL